MGLWVSMIVIADITVLPLTYLHAVDLGQKPLAFLLSSLKLAMNGLFILGILTAVIYFSQFRKFWLAHSLILLLLGAFFFKDVASGIKAKYAAKEKIVALK
jgi:RsiW-degrading membrane proteinase PrsW (M82 family)